MPSLSVKFRLESRPVARWADGGMRREEDKSECSSVTEVIRIDRRATTVEHHPARKGADSPSGVSLQESLENPLMVRTLKGVESKEPTRALADRRIDWKRISWRKVEKKVRDLQMRIAKAVSGGMRALVRKLQAILTRSFGARLLAVRRATTNKGRKTPGTDGVIWYTPNQKMMGAARLKRRRGYRPLPLRRVYLRKKSGKLRPLGIPTMYDRAMQAVYAMALTPVAETTADPHSYGFRPYRSCADAVGQCFNALSQKHSSGWVLEADINMLQHIEHQAGVEFTAVKGKGAGQQPPMHGKAAGAAEGDGLVRSVKPFHSVVGGEKNEVLPGTDSPKKSFYSTIVMTAIKENEVPRG